MDYTFWYIVLIATNLASPEARNFDLVVTGGGADAGRYAIYSTRQSKIWTIDRPQQVTEVDGTAPPFSIEHVNFKIDKKNEFRTLLTNTPISVDQFCDCEGVDWSTINEIKVKSFQGVDDQTPIQISRTDTGFSVSQKKGFLQRYTGISVELKKKK